MRPLVHGYDELKLSVNGRDTGRYDVRATTSAAEASTSFELPFSELEIENFILKVSRPRGRRRVDTSAIGEARRFGGGLFQALFSGDVHELYRDSLANARSQECGVRITLCMSQAPDLIDVPWEYLFDDPDFLAVSAFTPVVRYLDLRRSHRALLAELPLRVLGIISSPAEYEQLDVERERANLEGALSELGDVGAVELHWLERPTLGALLRALQAQTFHALHYIGHGTYDSEMERGVLLFEDEAGWSRPVSGDKLGMIVHDFASLRLTVLNACEGARTSRTDPFAGVAGSLVQRDIPAVVAMQFEISDEAAIVFAGGFYRSVAAGAPVDASLAAARLAMLAERSDDIEWGTPVLFMRVPDGRLFDFDGSGDLAGGGQLTTEGALNTTVAAKSARSVAGTASTASGSAPADGNGTETATGGSGSPVAAGTAAAPTARQRRRPLLAGGVLAVLLASVAAVPLLSRSSSTVRESLTAAAAPFKIVYGKPWRSVSTPVTGSFVLRDGGAARLVSGSATLAAGQLAASAAVPAGVPPALLRRYGRPAASSDARIAGHAGREYAWSLRIGSLIAYVLPTAAADAAIICGAPRSADAALRSCGLLAERARAPAKIILAPGADRYVARALDRPLNAAKTVRMTIENLGGGLTARAKAFGRLSQTETRALAVLRKLPAPLRYRSATSSLAGALQAETLAITALANAARSNDPGAYSRAVGRVAAASHGLSSASRQLAAYHLGVPMFAVLRLKGPPRRAKPNVQPTQAIVPSTVTRPSTTSAAPKYVPHRPTPYPATAGTPPAARTPAARPPTATTPADQTFTTPPK